MSVLEFKPRTVDDTAAAMEVIDSLRQAVLDGRIKAFMCVGITDDNQTMGWSSCTKHVTRLEMLGAIADLSHAYGSGHL